MSLRNAVKSWNPRQHFYVFAIGLGLISTFTIVTAFVALAYVSPGAFLSILALAVFSYILGAVFSELLLDGREE